jgi:hypothetical protein
MPLHSFTFQSSLPRHGVLLPYFTHQQTGSAEYQVVAKFPNLCLVLGRKVNSLDSLVPLLSFSFQSSLLPAAELYTPTNWICGVSGGGNVLN